MDRAFAKNDRVRLSERGRKVYSRSPPDRLGTVYHEPIKGFRVHVLWDGLMTKAVYHHTMLEYANATVK